MGIEQGHADLKSSTLPYELIQKSAGFLNLEARGSKPAFGELFISTFFLFPVIFVAVTIIDQAFVS